MPSDRGVISSFPNEAHSSALLLHRIHDKRLSVVVDFGVMYAAADARKKNIETSHCQVLFKVKPRLDEVHWQVTHCFPRLAKHSMIVNSSPYELMTMP